jgi:hypothetical protein
MDCGYLDGIFLQSVLFLFLLFPNFDQNLPLGCYIKNNQAK